MRRLLTIPAAALALSGCAHAPVATAPAASEAVAVPQMDLATKFRMPARETGRRDRATVNAQYHLALEADENGPPTAAQILRAQEQRNAILREAASRPKVAGALPSRWEALGPSNVAGRVRALAFDPRNPARLLAGTASGGLWISTDAGLTWRANQDFLPNLSITTLAFDPSNPDVVYLGTGEASGGLVGIGAFKSVDGGNTWQYLAATNADANPDWRFVNRLAVHPTQPNVVLAALTNNARNGGAVYRSVDGGASWTRASTAKALDIAFDPHDPSRAVAGLDDGKALYSRDAGASWTRTAALVESPSGRGNTARIEIAFARSQSGVVYASVDNNKGEVWRSDDSGANWTMLSNPQHLNVQGDYDNAIWVDPTDANHVVVAGLDIYQSHDGGATFLKVSDWRQAPSSAHADHHALVSPPDFGPSHAVLYNGNDGGIYRASNIYSVVTSGWTNMNAGLAITQFYSGAGSAAAGGRIIGGTQDNGSLQLSGGSWRAVRGGDGGFSAVDPASDQVLYGEYVYLSLHRSLNGGQSASYICEGITEGLPAEDNGNTYCGAGATKQANFIAPFILDPNNSSRLLAGGASLWVSDNARGTPPGWVAIKAPSAVTDNFINAIAVAPGNSNVIWVGHNNGEIYRALDGTAASPTWTRIAQGVIPSRAVQRITIDRDNPNRVIVSLTGFTASNVWQTLDGGATWASITGNLPLAPVFDVKRHAAHSGWLYAATSVGVFTSENGGTLWSTTNEGPANIRVRELFWIDANTLGAATYGRGMFKLALDASGAPDYQDLWWGGEAENGWGMSLTQHGATMFGALYIYDAQGRPMWAVLPGGTWNAAFTSFTGSLYVPSGSWFGSYDATRFAANAPVGTATLTFTDASNATLAYSINGASGVKPLKRQPFGVADATPVATYGDLWWGGSSENGWGVAISQQYRTLFSAWYTYDPSGKTIWYVIPGGAWTAANVYTGTAYRTTGSPWAGATYNPLALAAQAVGTVTFTFTDLNHGVMSYVVDGVAGSKPIMRQPF
ncbi:MAG: WD40/YVTN/BNR-like repeat-containing protein [Usitatibacter sp.]